MTVQRPASTRFLRQLSALERRFPAYAGTLRRLRERRWWMLRLPLGLMLIAGSFLAILPVFGLWMLPVGLLLLAIDLPFLQNPTASLMVRARRRLDLLVRRLRR